MYVTLITYKKYVLLINFYRLMDKLTDLKNIRGNLSGFYTKVSDLNGLLHTKL